MSRVKWISELGIAAREFIFPGLSAGSRFSPVAMACIMTQTTATIIELNMDTVEEILRRVEAKELQADDYETIKALAQSYVHLTELLKDKNTSLSRLRKMLFGATTEKTAAVLGSSQPADIPSPPGDDAHPNLPPATNAEPNPEGNAATNAENDSATPGKGHGRNGAAAYTGAEKIEVPLASLQAGDPCPKCDEGTVYETNRPGVLVRLVGQPPVGAKVYYLQKLRCNLCGAVFTADHRCAAVPAPEGEGGQKYDATAGSMIALLKYGNGMPFYRMEGLQENLGIPLPTSTQWDIVHAQAERIEPAFEELVRQAAQGDVVHNDDTTVKILDLMDERARQEAFAADRAEGPAKKKAAERVGMFTTGIVSTHDDHKIALFLSGRQHAGENLADVLAQRAADLAFPIQMCDALSRNMPADLKTILGNCLAHGRRQFVDVVEQFPEECRHVLEALSVPYRNDAIARERNLSAEERLLFHQAQSGPTMEELHAWLLRQFDERRVEPNSGLGGAISYLLKHWEKLTLFLRVAGAPLDNNICERALKKAILHRKNALFYKTCHGAHVGDIFMSLIYTCELCKVNPFDYLTELDRHAEALSANPRDWAPWNYRQTLAGAATPSGTAS
jgi:transposase